MLQQLQYQGVGGAEGGSGLGDNAKNDNDELPFGWADAVGLVMGLTLHRKSSRAPILHATASMAPSSASANYSQSLAGTGLWPVPITHGHAIPG